MQVERAMMIRMRCPHCNEKIEVNTYDCDTIEIEGTTLKITYVITEE